ncbi:putative acyl-activating enzyme 5, peroxisomal [Heracleum sosnowskyi]|uniref:Acyl-activating enzyme 5, peroxisomal n=1 Tax=Heracleum sosnowskyi TaxID=360622 RepID=A0AAD8H647_9APIA|nr:putative acyl-activating enzyme 5, peroxisomal [Heracleum sosnowskyi]
MDEMGPTPANSTPFTPLSFLERAAVVYGDTPSLIYNTTTYTWSQTHRRCLQLASSISSLSISPGDVVSVLAPNIPAMYELHFAVPMSGAVLNCINTRLNAHTISILLRHSESKLIFVDYQMTSVVLQALSGFPPHTPRPILVVITENNQASFPEFDFTYDSLVERGDPMFDWIRPRSEWDPIVLNYTSGTTASPKGVVLSHRNAFIKTVDSLLEWSVPKQPVFLWALPMFHANGWGYTWGMAVVGGTNICLRKFDSDFIYDNIIKHGVTHMCGAPVVLNMLSNNPSREKLTNPVHILTGGAPPPAAVLMRTEELGFLVSHGYGLTEVGGIVVMCMWKWQWNSLPAREKARLKSRQGVGTMGCSELDVVEPESGVGVKRDGVTVGEVVLRGGCVMLGYLKDKEGTSQCMKGKWFYTGDVGVMHEDGYLEIKDRSKDVIISGGENVSSVEVESVLYLHPAVNEAAVVACPDEFWGETPCAFVSLNCGKTATKKEIIEFCREKLPRYMVPRKVVFKEDLPKTSTGKIQKFLLREMAKDLVSWGSNGGRSKMLGSRSDRCGARALIRIPSAHNSLMFCSSSIIPRKVYAYPYLCSVKMSYVPVPFSPASL